MYTTELQKTAKVVSTEDPEKLAAFEVDDLPALVADLKAKGVAFAAEGIESPVCHMAVIKDPDGNAIILHKLKSAEERAGN